MQSAVMFERYTEKARRVIFFARYEASRFGSPNIETEPLLLGLLREEKTFAAELLRGQGVTLAKVREQVGQSELGRKQEASIPALSQRLAELEARGAIRSVKQIRFPSRTAHFAIYKREPPQENEPAHELPPPAGPRRYRGGSTSSPKQWNSLSPIMTSRRRVPIRRKNAMRARNYVSSASCSTWMRRGKRRSCALR